jgi:hypothetical protein
VNDYFQYDYVLVHVNDYFQYDYVHVNDYFPKAVRGTPLHQLVTATTLYGYIEQGPSTISMSNPRDNSAPVNSVNRLAFGYILNLLCVFLLFKFYLSFNLNTCTCFALTGSLINVMNLLIISEIKMHRKLSNCLAVPWWNVKNNHVSSLEIGKRNNKPRSHPMDWFYSKSMHAWTPPTEGTAAATPLQILTDDTVDRVQFLQSLQSTIPIPHFHISEPAVSSKKIIIITDQNDCIATQHNGRPAAPSVLGYLCCACAR